jgi:DNA-binding transcriptional MerR regulator
VKLSFPGNPSPEKEYYTIGEIGRLAGVKPHVLRYWERELSLLRPIRRASGHRQFTRRDLSTVQRIRELLYEKRFTLEGAKKLLRQENRRGPAPASLEFGQASAAVDALREVKAELKEILETFR